MQETLVRQNLKLSRATSVLRAKTKRAKFILARFNAPRVLALEFYPQMKFKIAAVEIRQI